MFIVFGNLLQLIKYKYIYVHQSPAVPVTTCFFSNFICCFFFSYPHSFMSQIIFAVQSFTQRFMSMLKWFIISWIKTCQLKSKLLFLFVCLFFKYFLLDSDQLNYLLTYYKHLNHCFNNIRTVVLEGWTC